MTKNTHNQNNKDNIVWQRLWRVIRTNPSLNIITATAVLLVATTAVMYHSAQRMIHRTAEQLVQSEMSAIASDIRKQLAKVESAVNNMDWILRWELENPDSLYVLGRQLVANNSAILGCGILFRPHYYPEKGRWFEPYALRHDDGTIETMQLGSASHDYTQEEFYTFTMEHDSDHWSEPYMDWNGAKRRVTTYSRAVHDDKGETVAVVGADLSMEWLEKVMEHPKRHKSTYRFLLSREGSLMAGKRGSVFEKVWKLVQEDSDRTGHVAMTDSEGERLHVFYYAVGGITQWTLICVCNDQEIFAPLRQTRRVLLLLQLAGLLLVGFIVWRSSRSLKRLREVNAEKNRIDGELKVASEIQQSMLPKREWNATHGEWGVEIQGSLVPAREVGGDLFDYYVRDEKLFFCIGDVSGKGAPSAMVMSVTHALFHAASAHESNPARIMHVINETACEGNESNMFVTLFIGVLDLPTGRLHYCDAGHDAPMKLRTEPEGLRIEELPVEPHLPLGVFADVRYEMQETLICPGSTLFLYTDGLTEAMNKEHKLFGKKRVESVLHQCAQRPLTPKEILQTMNEEVQRFVGGAEQSDDLTMLAIRYTSSQYSVQHSETLMLKSKMSELKRLGDFMKRVTENLGIEKSLRQQLRLAVEEAVVNVIEYAYPKGELLNENKGCIEVIVRTLSDGETLHIQIIDSGIPFDPTAKEKADTTLSAEERPIGGLGILLMRELMDTINYERIDGKNVLTMVKKGELRREK